MRAPRTFRWKSAAPHAAGFGIVKFLLVAAFSVSPPLALADDRQGLGMEPRIPSGCCGNAPTVSEVSFYVLDPGIVLFLGTNGGSPMLLQIEVIGTGQSAELFVNCGDFVFNDAVTNSDHGIAYKQLRDWGGCRLAVANVSSRSSGIKIGVSFVGQDATGPAALRTASSPREPSAQLSDG